MAEYIDRNLIEWYGCDYEKEPDCENRECSGCSHAECSHAQVMQIPKADVIERSKIDKAKEEIIELDREDLTFYDGVSNLGSTWYVCLDEVLEILERNIGE